MLAPSKELLRIGFDALGRDAPDVPLTAWGRRYLPHYFPLPFSPMHDWIGGQLDRTRSERGLRINVVGPRGGAKTTICSTHTLRAVCEHQEPYILLIAETGDQANKYLDAVKRELEVNDRIRRDYPGAFGRGPCWNVGRIVANNGVEIEALGMGHAIRGRKSRESRPSLIILDDPEGKKHALSPRERAKSWEALNKDVLNAGTDDTSFVAMGTALHRDCMVLRLLKHPDWTSRCFRSIEGLPGSMDMALWAEWEGIRNDQANPDGLADARQFYERNREAMDAGATCLWPDYEDLYALMSLRAAIGHNAFALEKQGNPVNPELCEWPEEHFGDHIWFDEWPAKPVVKVMALDPSKGRDSRHGDYSAICYYAVGPREGGRGLLYAELDLARRPTEQIVDDCVEGAARFRPDVFGVEANAFQHLMAHQLLDTAAERGVKLPVVEVENYVNKETRIRRLGPYLQQRCYRFRARSPGSVLTVEQLMDFPGAAHDDGPDALEMAQRLAIEHYNRGYLADDGLGHHLDTGVY